MTTATLMVYDDDDTRSLWSKDMVVAALIGNNKGLGYEIVCGLAK
jgi:hypothetical protein